MGVRSLGDNVFLQREAQLMKRSNREEAEVAHEISSLPIIDFKLSDVRSGASTYPRPLTSTKSSNAN